MAMYFFLFIGGPLPAPVVVSTHTVGVEECSLKCLEELHCFGFNFKSGSITNKFDSSELNCQISGRNNFENMEVMDGNDWVFYQVLSTVSK
jgi:hypothetical protein